MRQRFYDSRNDIRFQAKDSISTHSDREVVLAAIVILAKDALFHVLYQEVYSVGTHSQAPIREIHSQGHKYTLAYDRDS